MYQISEHNSLHDLMYCLVPHKIVLSESIQVFRSLKKTGQLALVSGLEKVT